MIILYILLLLVAFFPKSALAVYDPTSVPNNRFGIHIADSNDLREVPALVNSSGGDWGYITFVITDRDRDVGKWQLIFRNLRKLHLIPLVRIATHVEGASWVKPYPDDVNEWISFFSQLSWPTKNRYVILYNEPNHTNEWGGSIAPDQYAVIVKTFVQKLKESSSEFFLLPAGFDASAQNTAESLDEVGYLNWMLASEPQLFNYLDGWTSHSYPNPGFSGSPYARGRGTLTTYDWELSMLKERGVEKTLPVFITETGWAHSAGSDRSRMLPPDVVADYLETAAKTVWNDPRIVAVTPFLLQYQEPLFAMFSWLIPSSRQPYPFYLRYQSLSKVKGNPILPLSPEYLALLSHTLSL